MAECVETALRNRSDHIEVETIDLAGRQDYGTGRGGQRRYVLKLLQRLPVFARQRLVRFMLERKLRKLHDQWDAKIAAADAVVIGGGNLFQDDDLNFPLKVGKVLDCVSRHNRPLAIYAVGVSERWSRQAYHLFARLKQAQLVHLSVRDGFAQDNWREHFPDGPAVKIVRDPGLLVHAFSDLERHMPSSGLQPTVGLCVTDPTILQRHASRNMSKIPFCNIGNYRDLIGLLLDDGYRVILFCNGAREDQVFAEQIRNSVSMHRVIGAGMLDLAERPRVPDDLVRILHSTDVILAHRLHACIAAYALRIPHVGLGWDGKVEGFFNSVGREAYFVGDAALSPPHIAWLLKAAESEGIESLRHRATVAEAEAGITNMRRHLIGDDLRAMHKV
ncbi:polysaccharide pyruvyl transferase family protein [Rhizobium lusitanum]|nr:polysaccharide pyruvyl transferase family protein [Rhizobium lusitanum]